MPSIKGTASVADARARSKALKSTRFPKNFSKPVNLEKVNKPVLTQWIEQKVTSILGFDDEIVSSTAINLFLPSEEGGTPDPRRAQLDLVGFLGEEESAKFAKELWALMLEAESSPSGIPRTLLEQKKEELKQQKQAAHHHQQHPPAPPAHPSAARHRNPELNRFVQEAARRAQAAREMVGDPLPGEGRGPPGPHPRAPVPIPVSPPHPSEQFPGKPSRGGGPPECEDDRKPPPRNQRSNRSDLPPPPPAALPPPPREGYPPRGGGYGRDDRARFPYRSSRSRSSGRRGRDEAFRREEDARRDMDPRRRHGGSLGRERRRFHSDDEEIEELERRLSALKKKLNKRGDDYGLDDEIEDVKDRLYELERRRRRRRRDREAEEYRRRRDRHRGRVERRRHSRSPSDDSRRRSRSRSRSPSLGRRRRSPTPEPDHRERSRGRRSPSSESDASSRGSRSSSGSESSGRRRPSPQAPARASSHSSHSSSSSDYSD